MIALCLAAKEEAFQESIKLKNQFRNLDEDEVEFLDSVLESTRAKEEAVKKETSEQLELFRRQQEEADRGLLDEPKDTGDISGSPTEQSNDTQWTINARKRKRLKDEKILKGPKLLKVSSTGKESQMKPDDSTRDMPIDRESEIRTIRVSRDAPNLQENQAKDNTTPKRPRETSSESKSEAVSSSRSLPALGLADYSSEDD